MKGCRHEIKVDGRWSDGWRICRWRRKDIVQVGSMGSVVDYKMMTTVDRSSGKTEVEWSLCGVSVTHEETLSAAGKQFVVVVFDDIAYGSEDESGRLWKTRK